MTHLSDEFLLAFLDGQLERGTNRGGFAARQLEPRGFPARRAPEADFRRN